jgi:hypothetical protein
MANPKRTRIITAIGQSPFLAIGPEFKKVNKICHKPYEHKYKTCSKWKRHPAKYKYFAGKISGNKDHPGDRNKEDGQEYLSWCVSNYLSHGFFPFLFD